MRLLYSQAFSAGSLTYFLPNGKWGAFMLVYKGTNGSVAKTRDDVGSVLLTWNGNPLINVDFELLNYLTDLKGGFATFSSVANSIFYASCYIPCGAYNDRNNVYLIDDNEKVYFKLDYPELANITGQVFIYGVPKEGVNNYFYCLTSRNVSTGGAGIISDTHRLQNVMSIFLKDYNQVSDAQIIRDNDLIVDAPISDIKALSDYYNQTETGNPLIEIDLNRSRDIREVISSEITFKYSFIGAGTLQQYFAFSVLTPDQARRSVMEFQGKLQEKIQRGLNVPNVQSPIRPRAITVFATESLSDR